MPQLKSSLQQTTSEQERKQALSSYLYKYAAIANREMTAELLGIFLEALEDVPVKRIKVGLANYLRDGDRFPWPSDIRECSAIDYGC